jgi:hypothetical protein
MSEIRVDTISEKTSANGVAIDGVVIKDNTIDVNGTAGALILDADADTKIQASTDDNIEFLTGGSKQFNITNSGSIQAFRDSATSFGPSYLGQHQRGTIASPSIVSSGDRLVEFKSTAYDGTAYIDGPRISFRVDGTPGDDDMPSRIEFQTVADGSNALAERMRITSAGIVGMGANAGSCGLGSGLHIMTSDTGISATTHGDELVIEDGTSGANVGISILSNANGEGRINFGDGDDNDIGMIIYDHATDVMKLNTSNDTGFRIKDLKLSSYNEDAPDVEQGGLTLQQGGDDGMIMSFKSSDVAHGMTAVKQADTYGFIEKKGANDGGVKMGGFTDSGAGHAFEIAGFQATEDDSEATSSSSAVCVNSFKRNGSTTSAEGLPADGNAFAVKTADNTQLIVKGDGEIFSNQSATVGTYDTYEDAQLVRAYDLAYSRYETGLIDSKFDEFVQYNKDDLVKAKLIGKDKDGNATRFVNWTGMSRLHNGAIWQQYEKHQNLAKAVYELAKAAVGEEKANEILEQNEIKLLN